MRDFVLNGTLSPQHREAGLWLCLAPIDNSVLNLIHNGSVIATYSATGAKVEEIRADATEWMEKQKKEL